MNRVYALIQFVTVVIHWPFITGTARKVSVQSLAKAINPIALRVSLEYFWLAFEIIDFKSEIYEMHIFELRMKE